MRFEAIVGIQGTGGRDFEVACGVGKADGWMVMRVIFPIGGYGEGARRPGGGFPISCRAPFFHTKRSGCFKIRWQTCWMSLSLLSRRAWLPRRTAKGNEIHPPLFRACKMMIARLVGICNMRGSLIDDSLVIAHDTFDEHRSC